MIPDTSPRISVATALRRGFWMVKFPSMAVLIGPLVLGYFGEDLGLIPNKAPADWKWFGFIFAVAFFGGWLVWSIQVPRWRLWAYERVANIEALKVAAIESQLVWPDESIFTRTEIANRETWRQIREFESRQIQKPRVE